MWVMSGDSCDQIAMSGVEWTNSHLQDEEGVCYGSILAKLVQFLLQGEHRHVGSQLRAQLRYSQQSVDGH